MNDDADLVSTLARAITEKAHRENRSPQVVPATVVDYGSNRTSDSIVASVHIHGDPNTSVQQVSVLTPNSLASGDVVMVLYDPPAGAYILGQVLGGAADACRLTRNTGFGAPFQWTPASGVVTIPFTAVDYVDGRVTPVFASATDTYIQTNVSGLFQLNATCTHRFLAMTNADDGTSAFNFTATDPVTGAVYELNIWQTYVSKAKVGAADQRYTCSFSTLQYLAQGWQVRLKASHDVVGKTAQCEDIAGRPATTMSLACIGGRFIQPS